MKIQKPKHHIGDVLVVTYKNNITIQVTLDCSWYVPKDYIWFYQFVVEGITIDTNNHDIDILYNLTRNTLDQSTDTE